MKEALAKKAELIKSPYCFGVFIDGELPWSRDRLALVKGVLACPEHQSSKKKFAEVLEKKYGSIERLNSAWKSGYKSFEDFLKTKTFVPQTQEAMSDMGGIRGALTPAAYFHVCRDAIKEIDPKAMYLGAALE